MTAMPKQSIFSPFSLRPFSFEAPELITITAGHHFRHAWSAYAAYFKEAPARFRRQLELKKRKTRYFRRAGA